MRFDVIDGPFADADWHPLSIVGDEALNDLFVFQLTLHARAKVAREASYDELHDGLVGRRVTLEMHPNDTKRVGIIASIEVDPRALEEEPLVVRVTMRPRVWLLSHRKNTRIFQQKYVHEIVSTVLSESKVQHRWLLENSYPKRQLCTQYEETDLAFIQRILAEEGIFTFFEHANDFEPTPGPAFPESTPEETYAAVAGVAGAILSGIAPQVQSNAIASGTMGTLGSLASASADMVTKYVDPEADDPIDGASGRGGDARKGPVDVFVFADSLNGYVDALPRLDPETNAAKPPPRDPRLAVEYRGATLGFVENAVTKLLGARAVAPRKVEIRDYNFRKPMALLSKSTEATDAPPIEAPLDVYEHHGEYEKPDVEDEQAKIRIEQLRSRSNVLSGESTAPMMMPGFLLEFGHAPLPFSDGPYVPTRVHHEATLTDASPAAAAITPEAKADARVADALAAVLAELRSAPDARAVDIGTERQRPATLDVRALVKQALSGVGVAERTYKNKRRIRSWLPGRTRRSSPATTASRTSAAIASRAR